ncbi:MAG: AMP-binding protein [Chloroflexota bacterium]|nr:AMP-binding protein [Chloroflexota bacterium]
MVLGKLQILGVPIDEDEFADAGRASDGAPLTFPQMLEDNRRTWGDKIQLQEKVGPQWRRLSYGDVYRRSCDLSAGLVALGLHAGDRVALSAENSIDWACSYYAIVLAGGIAVPLYYDLSGEEIAEMIERCEADVALVSRKVLAKLGAGVPRLRSVIVLESTARPDALPLQVREASAAEILSLGELASRATQESRVRLASTVVRPDDVASIVFTSGTTGGMKGVTLTHRNFMANMRSIRASIPFAERDRLVMVLPMHHAFPFVVGMVVGAAVGAELTFENDLRRIRDRMAEVKPTLFLGVPALFELMYRNIVHGIETQGRLESFERGLHIVDSTKQRTGINIGRIVFRELHKRLGGSLRFMVSGGAALNPQVARDFARLGVPIIQGWGMTEASPVLSVQPWSPRKFYMSNYYEEHLGTVGMALSGVEIGLIDVPEKELYVHLHGEGELVARGENITPGYWNSPEATAAIKVGEWLRTGDVGRIDDEGNVWITGRSKFVIVLDSGEKVHPDEVEEKIARSAAISDVVVIGRRVRGKTQAWAVVYPNRDEILERLGIETESEEVIRRLIAAEIDAHEHDIAPYKHVADFMLTDMPLPKTALRKVARGQIADSYDFELSRWEESWREYVEGSEAPVSDDSEEALTA